MNLIKQLFGHHRHEESAPSASVNWPGQSGKGYQYTVYSLDNAFQPLPGLYIYAGQAEDGSWVPSILLRLAICTSGLRGT